ncbi:MAG: hypothetical protein ACOCP8_07040 [archaeon]
MKHVLSYKMFENKINESNSYKRHDIVTIRYWLTGDVVPVKIKKSLGKNKYLVSFDVPNNPYQNASDMVVNRHEIIGGYSLTNDPVTFRNPMNVPSEFIRRDFMKQSNDIAINGYPKTLV